MEKAKIFIIYEEGQISSLAFEELVYIKGEGESEYTFFNRAKAEIERLKKINFRDYFTPDNVIKVAFPETTKIEEKVNEKLSNQAVEIKNTHVYQQTINKCLEDVLSGKQILLNSSNYNLGKQMFVSQNIGKKRNNQEDSALILEHPQNNDFKLIAVADGVGGEYGGELASRHVLVKLSEWFNSLPPQLYNNMPAIQQSLDYLLSHIMDDLVYIPKGAATTLSCAIIGKDQTLITNIGDSRVYTTKDQNITQETKDDSIVQALYENGKIPNKELMRFNVYSNVIRQSINKQKEADPHYKIINNSNYDRIIAVSDGVSDCLTTEELKNIITISKPEYVASNIVDKALNTTSTLSSVINNLPNNEKRQVVKNIKNKEDYYQTIYGGKDNTSVAAYIKK